MNVQETKTRLLGAETADDAENILAELSPEQRDELKDSLTVEESIKFIEKVASQLTGPPTGPPTEEADLSVGAKLSCVQTDAGGRYFKVVVVLDDPELGPEPQELEFYATDKTVTTLVVQAMDDRHESSSFVLATSQETADEQTLTE